MGETRQQRRATARELAKRILHGEPSRAKELVLASIGLFGEFLAVRLDHTWLAILGALLLWLAFLDYTKGRQRVFGGSAWLAKVFIFVILAACVYLIRMPEGATHLDILSEIREIPDRVVMRMQDSRKEKPGPSASQPRLHPAPSPQTPALPARPGGSPKSIGPVTVQPGSVASIGQRGGITAGQVNINTEPVPTPVVPTISVATQAGLTLTDFQNLVVSPEMMKRLRRHSLTVSNPNTLDLHNVAIRFQLPEPVIGSLLIEDRPAGVEITWNACRLSFALTGDGASATPLPGGGTEITTGATRGSIAALNENGEVCSAAMNNERLRPTDIYLLRIERLPAVTAIRLAFLTFDGPDGSPRVERGKTRDSEPTLVLSFFGEGSFQYSSLSHTEKRSVFVPLRFDWNLRTIGSSPTSEEHGKWKLRIKTSN